MNKNTTDLLQNIADKLKVGVEKLWPILVHQERLQGIIDLILVLCFFSLSYLFYKGYKFIKNNEKEVKEEIYIIFWIHSLLYSVLMLALIVDLDKIITQIINPEFYALKFILSFR